MVAPLGMSGKWQVGFVTWKTRKYASSVCRPCYRPDLYRVFANDMMRRKKAVKSWERDVDGKLDLKLRKLVDSNALWNLEATTDPETGVLRLAPDWLSQLSVYELVEQGQNQEYMLFAMAHKKGWKV